MYATIRRTSILELLGPLGIMGIQSRAPLKHHRQYGAEGLKKALNWAPIMLRQASFLNGWRWNFQHLLETRNDRREKRTTNILWCREKSCVFFPQSKVFYISSAWHQTFLSISFYFPLSLAPESSPFNGRESQMLCKQHYQRLPCLGPDTENYHNAMAKWLIVIY